MDIDLAELNKPTVKLDIAINADLRDFFSITLKLFQGLSNGGVLLKSKTGQIPKRVRNDVLVDFPDFLEWLKWCRERKEKYPVVLPEYKNIQNAVNPYYFIETLTKCLNKEAIVVSGNGTASVCTFQASIVKENQKFIINSGNASMGYDLPAAIGACFASDKKDIICLPVRRLMMNIQELQTIYSP